jgi:hypothetical protein
MGRKYIIFRADCKEEHGAFSRQLAHTAAMTDIVVENFDSSTRIGYWLVTRVKE